MVRGLRRTGTGWELTVGPTRKPEAVGADAVILAVPAAPASRLLRAEVPHATAELAQVRASSMAVVSIALPAGAVPGPLPGSGFLVPPVDGRTVKAVTFSSAKWSWYADSSPWLLLRASVGRLGEEATLQRSDTEIVDLVLADLTEALGVTDPPVDARVTRWGGALPQYAVGHRGRVDRIRAAVSRVPALAVCGATYDGIGVPACIATAEAATSEVLRQWRRD